jgi:CCR4-NOT transcription complex subunit 1
MSIKKTGANECEIQFKVENPMKGPVSIYYRLTNFYQNNRLYAKSRSDAQLRGEALTKAELNDCDPLISDSQGNVYYPCGLVANSYFLDTFSSLKHENGKIYDVSSEKIAWPGDEKLYGESKYDLSQTRIAVPPSWANRDDIDIENGFYKALPNLAKDERFQNWMKISGLPTFRKLYGRVNVEEMDKGLYTVTIKDTYEVSGYQGTKSFVISTTSWAGGKNDSLGYGFIAVGGLLLVLGLVFLIMFMMAPRKVGDVSYLSWYSENSGDPLAADETENGEEIQFGDS